MRVLCHRCHGELPEPVAGSSRGDEDALLFCPRCGAPQLLLPEHMRAQLPAEAIERTTGAVPPPRLLGRTSSAGSIDWRAALPAGAAVAAVAALLMIAGLAFTAAAFIALLWKVGGAVVALAIYARLRPQAEMDARIGTRVGVVAGVLMLFAMAAALSATGIVMRFGTHSMAHFDAENAEQRKAVQNQVLTWFQQNFQDKDLQAKYAEQINSPFMTSPEVQAGSALAGLAFQGMFILLFSAGGGAFTGMLRGSHAARAGLRPGS